MPNTTITVYTNYSRSQVLNLHFGHNINIIMTPLKIIANWLSKVKQARPELNGKSICPFARMPGIIPVEKLSIQNIEPLGSQITIYIETAVNSTFDELETLCRKLNKKHKKYIFLPDHPQKKNYINGVETGNEHLPLIIVQTRKELLTARSLLEKTDYYDFWSDEYIKEIKSYGN